MNTVSEQKKLEVSDLSVNVIKKNIKNLHVSVLPPDGKVRVTAPLKMKEEAIRLAVVSRLSWIKEQQSKFLSQDRQSERTYVSGESHYYLGRHYRLKVITTDAPMSVFMKGKNQIVLQVKPKTAHSKKEQLMMQWYRLELRKQLDILSKRWSKKMNVDIHRLEIKRMKTRWGTCNQKNKVIWLNLELIKKPTSCIEYVLVHELCHFFEKSHNQQFVKLMDKIMPTWEARKEELNSLPLAFEQWEY